MPNLENVTPLDPAQINVVYLRVGKIAFIVVDMYVYDKLVSVLLQI